MPRLRRAVVAGVWLAVASFALAVPLRVAADDTPVPPETVPSTSVVATTADTTSVTTTTEEAPTTTPAPTESATATTTTAEATTTAAATTATTPTTTTAATSTTTASTAPPAVTEAERPARAPLPAAQSKRRVAPVTTTAKPPKAGAPKTTAALRPAPVLPELVTGVVELRFPGAPAHLPLRVTPPLEGGPYVFPVSGEPVWGDSYGAPRSEVAGGWHHGDDIFAMLGTPVVAVADGTVNRVGWDRLGGWGLWVRDRAGNEFYYAHLSGYSKLGLLSTQVRAGDVIGFIGNTGDAFTTVPHLHFEVHPRGLLQLGYDGAVDPTTYLRSWRHVRPVAAGRPLHPPFPSEVAWRAEALQNFRRLLDARGLDRPRQHRGAQARLPTSERVAPLAGALVGAPPVAAAPVEGRHSQSWLWALLGASLLTVALVGALGWRRRRQTGSAAAG